MKSLFCLTAVALMFAASCKKTDNTTKTEPPKTLTKSFLYDKTWYSKGNVVSHRFNSNGTYGTIGKWNWINDADSMFIDYTTGTDQIYYFDWSSEKECSIRHTKGSGAVLFKDYKW